MRLSEGEAERAGVEVRADAAEDDADQNHPDRLGYRARGQRDGADKPHDHQREILGRAEAVCDSGERRSEEHTSELQSLMRISYAVFCLTKKTNKYIHNKEKRRRKIHTE